jgi:hypothetical protein
MIIDRSHPAPAAAQHRRMRVAIADAQAVCVCMIVSNGGPSTVSPGPLHDDASRMKASRMPCILIANARERTSYLSV